MCLGLQLSYTKYSTGEGGEGRGGRVSFCEILFTLFYKEFTRDTQYKIGEDET